MPRPLTLRCWLCVTVATLLAMLLASRGLRADEPPRKLALLALIDNDSSNTPKGDLAEAVGAMVTRSINSGGKYDKLRLLVGERATRVAFFKALHALAKADYVIDVILETHGNTKVLAVRDGDLTGAEIRKELFLKGGEKVRMVYMMGCYSGSVVEDWIAVGARAVTGFTGLNVVPVFHYPAFLDNWKSGMDARTSTEKAYQTAKSGARTGWYKEFSKAFSGESITEKDIDEGSVPVFAGSKVTINDIPTREEEQAWVRAHSAGADDLDAELDRVFGETLGTIDGAALRSMVRQAK